MVMCVKYQKELPGLDTIPWPGELGQRIFDNVSKEHLVQIARRIAAA